MERLVSTKGIMKRAELIWSDAYQKLTANELRIYEIFLMKCKIVGKNEAKRTGLPVGLIKNNGQITFNYSEAQKIGIAQSTFTRSIDHLVTLGFIDIAVPGRQCLSTRYSISQRWEKYGTDKFVKKERKRRIPYKPGKGTRFTALSNE